jgi:hypothetical protein
MLPPLQANRSKCSVFAYSMFSQLSVYYTDHHVSCVGISFLTRHAGMCDETSASHSRNHASAYVPLRDNSMPG